MLVLRKCLLLATAAMALGLVACGGSTPDATLKVSAATSLKDAVTEISSTYAGGSTQLEFAGSDTIATAIRAGRRPDAFLAASLKIPGLLAAEHLVNPPVVFARNRVVVAVKNDNDSVRSIDDLAKPGMTIAIGSPSVPIGSYADKILAALPSATQAQIKANVKTREPDAASVSAKVTSGSVDAAILYQTDVKASKGALKAVQIPVALGSMTNCAASVVRGTGNETAATNFIANLLSSSSQKTLVERGFLPAPKTK